MALGRGLVAGGGEKGRRDEMGDKKRRGREDSWDGGEAPTAMAVGARAGDTVQALMLPLPAPTMTGTLAATTFATALSSAAEAPPPSDRLATAGLRALRATKSRPAITPLSVPLPLQSSTRTGASATCLATPKARPPTVPATWVP